MELAVGPGTQEHFDNQLPIVPLDALDTLSLLPPSITSFSDVGWLQLDTATLIALLADRRLIPNLRSLVVPDSNCDDEGAWTMRTAEDMEAVERAAVLRGVELQWQVENPLLPTDEEE